MDKLGVLTPKKRKPKTDSPSWEEEGMGAREKEIKAQAKIESGRERKFDRALTV